MIRGAFERKNDIKDDVADRFVSSFAMKLIRLFRQSFNL